MTFFCSRIQLGSHITFNHVSLVSSDLWQFFSLSLFFVTLIHLKSTSEVFCRMSVNLGLCGVFSLVGFGEEYHRSDTPFTSHHIIHCILFRIFAFVFISEISLWFYFFEDFTYFLGRGKGKERETSMCDCLLSAPLLGTWPTTQACTLTGNQTSDPLLRSLALNPLSHASQGEGIHNSLGHAFTASHND